MQYQGIVYVPLPLWLWPNCSLNITFKNAGKRVIHHCVATWTPLSNEMKMKGLLGIDAEPTPHVGGGGVEAG